MLKYIPSACLIEEEEHKQKIVTNLWSKKHLIETSDTLIGMDDTDSNDEIHETEAGTENTESMIPSNGNSPEAPDSTTFCLVCHMTTRGLTSDAVLIQPCRCGYWIHDQCLVNVAIQFEDFVSSSGSIGCKACKRRYNVLPVKSTFLKFVEKLSKVWYQEFCYFSMEFFIVLFADITFNKVGSLVLKTMYGPSEATRLVSTMSPLRVVLSCQMISVASIAVSSIPWEHSLLKLLRKCSRLPLVGGVFPIEDKEVRDIYEDNLHLNITGGLLLPFYATVTSRFFTGLVEDPFHRFLLGGTTFVLLKGGCKMYYKQKKYARFCRLGVNNFVSND